MTWEQAPGPNQCGSCRSAIKAGTPMLLVSEARKVRCVACASDQYQSYPPAAFGMPQPRTQSPEPASFATPGRFAETVKKQFDARMAATGERE